MKLDKFLPQFHFDEVHSVRVRASALDTYEAIKQLSAAELSPVVHLLLLIRALPARLMGQKEVQIEGGRPFLGEMVDKGFVLLADSPDEIVLGTVGQFWKPMGALTIQVGRDDFVDFVEPGYAKVAMNLMVELCGDVVVLRTETRIWTPDAETYRKFGRYWFVIRMGSGLIRRLWLRAIKRRAEKRC